MKTKHRLYLFIVYPNGRHMTLHIEMGVCVYAGCSVFIYCFYSCRSIGALTYAL